MFNSLLHRHPNSTAASASTLLLVSVTGLYGCAGNIKSTGAWQPSVPRSQSFSKLLIVGVSPNYDQRCAFEWALASHINDGSTQAFVSCDSMTSEIPLTRENIERVVASTKTDAVLATTLVAAKAGSQEGGSRDTRGSGEGAILIYTVETKGSSSDIESSAVGIASIAAPIAERLRRDHLVQ